MSNNNCLKILVTGATGFVGSELVKSLLNGKCHQVVSAMRRIIEGGATVHQFVAVGEIDAATDWTQALKNVNAVVHTAARAHIMDDSAQDPLAEFRRVNVEGTLNLARQAIDAGVKRFIFISSIKVNGEGESNRGYRFDDSAAPEDDYGLSKWEAEQGLKALCSESSMELVVIRPPLIYGPGVKGNLALLAKAIDKGLPLPLGAIKNQRDMLSLDNLIDLIKTCIEHPAAAGQVFLCCDNEPVSTPQLIKRIASGRGKNARLWKVPVFVLSLFARLAGRQAMLKRLSSDFRIDIQHTMNTLDWTPPFSVAQSMNWAFAKKL
jgi:UDP-N-acetyl-alpha-D-quinovosamine dehydrogenase